MHVSKNGEGELAINGDVTLTGQLFAIDRYAIHDGPGVRSLIFMKGCPLRCTWCSNPEGQAFKPELAFFPAKCIGCGACADICPRGAIKMVEGMPDTNWQVCDHCGKCVEPCFAGARKLFGMTVTVKALLEEIRKDLVFFDNSGGGVTIGGGEVTAQPEFAIAVLKKCADEEINTAIETCGYCSWKNLKAIAKYTDLVYYDIKHMDPEKHRRQTGVSNEKILKNLVRLSGEDVELIIRIPVIPGYNDDEANIKASVDFIKQKLNKTRLKRLELLPYHRLGGFKYDRMGKKYNASSLEPPGDEEMESLKLIVERGGLDCQIGG